MGVLSQTMGTRDRPVAYLETAGQCCHWVAGMLTDSCCSCLVQEAAKLTLGEDLIVKVPHEVNTLL